MGSTQLESRRLCLVEPPADAPSSGRGLGWIGVLLALVVAASALAQGFYDQNAYAWVALGMLGLLVAVWLAAGPPVPGPGRLAGLALTGLLGWTALSMTWAESVERAWTEVDRLTLYAAALLVGLVAVRTVTDAGRVLRAIAGVTGLLAIVTLARLIGGAGSLFITQRLAAPFDYINGAAGLSMMGFWPALALAVASRRRPLAAAGWLALAAVQLDLLVLTQSRAAVPALLVTTVVVLAAVGDRSARAMGLLVAAAGAAAALPWTLAVYERGEGKVDTGAVTTAGVTILVTALAAGGLWALALAVRHRPWARRTALLTVRGALVVVVLAPLIAVGNPVDAVGDRWRQFRTLEVDTNATSRFTTGGGYRYDLWRIALRDFADNPVGGLGAGNYGITYYQQRRNPDNLRQPHSLPLQLLAETGLVGLLLLVILIVAVTAGARRLLRTGPEATAVVAGLGGVAITWLVHTSVDWLWNIPGLTLLALIAAAGLCAGGAEGTASRRRRPVTGVLFVLLAVAAAGLGRHHAALVQLDTARSALPRDPERALRASSRSLQLDAENVDARILRAAAFARFGAGAAADRELARAIRLEPSNYVPWALRGDLAVRRGRGAAAGRYYRAALDRNPRDPGLAALVGDYP